MANGKSQLFDVGLFQESKLTVTTSPQWRRGGFKSVVRYFKWTPKGICENTTRYDIMEVKKEKTVGLWERGGNILVLILLYIWQRTRSDHFILGQSAYNLKLISAGGKTLSSGQRDYKWRLDKIADNRRETIVTIVNVREATHCREKFYCFKQKRTAIVSNSLYIAQRSEAAY